MNNMLSTNDHKSSAGDDSVPTVSHKGRIVTVERAVFEEFAVRSDSEEEEDSSSKDTVYLTESVKADIQAEKVCFQPITVSVPEETIHEKELVKTFGNKYIEGCSNPRLFAVKLHPDKTDEEFVIFYEHTSCSAESQDDVTCTASLVNISLTLHCNIPPKQSGIIHQRLSEQFSTEGPVCTIQEIVQCAEQHLRVNRSSDGTRTKKGAVKSKSKKATVASGEMFSGLALINGWSVQCYDKEDALKAVQNAPVNTHMPTVELPVSTLSSGDVANDLVCGICFDPCDGYMSSRAMQSCGHWFCHDCWCYHLVTRIMRGDLQLSCPGCKTVVDMVTLLSLLPYSYFVKYQSFVLNAKLERSGVWKWCQGMHGRCNKVIQAKSKNAASRTTDSHDEQGICVVCDCTAEWCFDCGKEPHWPTTCRQAEIYREQMLKNGDLKVESGKLAIQTLVCSVKKCPNCKYPMEKDGGCQYMQCHKCSHLFCWNCLGGWDHDFKKCDRTATKEEHFEFGTSKTTLEAYRKAVHWRKYGRRLLKQNPNLPTFLQEWIFVLEWSQAFTYICHAKSVNCRALESPMKSVEFCVNAMEQKVMGKQQNIKQVDGLKKSGEEHLRKLSSVVQRLQVAIVKADNQKEGKKSWQEENGTMILG